MLTRGSWFQLTSPRIWIDNYSVCQSCYYTTRNITLCVTNPFQIFSWICQILNGQQWYIHNITKLNINIVLYFILDTINSKLISIFQTWFTAILLERKSQSNIYSTILQMAGNCYQPNLQLFLKGLSLKFFWCSIL